MSFKVAILKMFQGATMGILEINEKREEVSVKIYKRGRRTKWNQNQILAIKIQKPKLKRNAIDSLTIKMERTEE